jgi:hypothetical protein
MRFRTETSKAANGKPRQEWEEGILIKMFGNKFLN